MPASESHRAFLMFIRALARDDKDREILVGLSYEESEWYFSYLGEQEKLKGLSKKSFDEQREEVNRYLELHDRHEDARRKLVIAEMEAGRAAFKN